MNGLQKEKKLSEFVISVWRIETFIIILSKDPKKQVDGEGLLMVKSFAAQQK